MTNLHKSEQSGVGIIWQCHDCGWESEPLDSFVGMTPPAHGCNPEKYLRIEELNTIQGRTELVTERGTATAIKEQDLRQTRNLAADQYPNMKWRHELIGNKLYILIATKTEKR